MFVCLCTQTFRCKHDKGDIQENVFRTANEGSYIHIGFHNKFLVSLSLCRQIYSLFLETLSVFIEEHREHLEDWIFLILLRLLHRHGSDLLGHMHYKLQLVLELIRFVDDIIVTSLQSHPPLSLSIVGSHLMLNSSSRLFVGY